MEIDTSKRNLKSALQGLERAVHGLLDEIKNLKQQNYALKEEIAKLKENASQHSSKSQKAEEIDMLDYEAINSIDMSINELKNMVQKK